jgi:hypothetical protein
MSFKRSAIAAFFVLLASSAFAQGCGGTTSKETKPSSSGGSSGVGAGGGHDSAGTGGAVSAAPDPECARDLDCTSGMVCRVGKCIAGYDCGPATCRSIGPRCDVGSTAEVAAGCWTGRCVPVSECREIARCEVCANNDLLCVVVEHEMSSQLACIEFPEQCQDSPGCDCLGPVGCVNGLSCLEASAAMVKCIGNVE